MYLNAMHANDGKRGLKDDLFLLVISVILLHILSIAISRGVSASNRGVLNLDLRAVVEKAACTLLASMNFGSESSRASLHLNLFSQDVKALPTSLGSCWYFVKMCFFEKLPKSQDPAFSLDTLFQHTFYNAFSPYPPTVFCLARLIYHTL